MSAASARLLTSVRSNPSTWSSVRVGWVVPATSALLIAVRAIRKVDRTTSFCVRIAAVRSAWSCSLSDGTSAYSVRDVLGQLMAVQDAVGGELAVHLGVEAVLHLPRLGPPGHR